MGSLIMFEVQLNILSEKHRKITTKTTQSCQGYQAPTFRPPSHPFNKPYYINSDDFLNV